MRTRNCFFTLSFAFLLLSARSTWASHDFVEDYDALPCCALADAVNINREVSLVLGPFFSRSSLASFFNEPILPVSNEWDLELLWENPLIGGGASLALTPDDEEGNYNFVGVKNVSDFAITGDLPSAEPRAGVVVRCSQGMFYCAYGEVLEVGGALKIRFHLEKWRGAGFVDLDTGPEVTDFFDFSMAENFRIGLEVTVPDEAGISKLKGVFERLGVAGGGLTVESLASLTGRDGSLNMGQVGVYAGAGSVHTQIAFDNTTIQVLAPSAASQKNWGVLKALYR